VVRPPIGSGPCPRIGGVMSDSVIWFDGWAPLGRILIVGPVMYAALVLVLRASGSRTLASMNAFDFIITVAIGSVFGRVLTASGSSLAEAGLALVLLILLQYLVAWGQTRWSGVRRLVVNPPVLLHHRGRFQAEAMRRHRVTEAEIRGAVRKQGVGSMDEVGAVILESDGQCSVIRSVGDASALPEAMDHAPSPVAGADTN